MGEGHQNHNHDFLLQHQLGGAPRSSRLGGLRGAAGEIVEVQGGHIIRSTGRKDRHSKVCTAKGPRDRRVRLSAHTAIQFYDVQDRLGYDRPSKAVDWLIKNAKAAIDELAELPPWQPTVATADATVANDPPPANYALGASGIGILPPSLDSDAIADTIKSFFPDAAAASSAYPEDLRLSLQSFRHPIPLQHHRNEDDHTPTGQAYFSGPSSSLVFDPAGYQDHNSRMLPWIANAVEAGDMFGMPPPPPPQQQEAMSTLGQSVFLAQRGPLQSSNPPFPRQWMEAIDHHAHAGVRKLPHSPRIHGEEEHDGISSLPPVASRR